MDEIPQPNDHLYDQLKHDKGSVNRPAQPNLSAYDSVDLKGHGNTSIPPSTTYDIAFAKPDTDGSNQQPVSNPVYSLGGLSNNPMYGTSADVEEVKQSLESGEKRAQNITSIELNGQLRDSEIENSDDTPPPIPPQNF